MTSTEDALQSDRPPVGGYPTPAGALMEQAYALYSNAFRPLVLTAGISALLLNSASLIIQPSNEQVAFVWSLLISGLTSGLLVVVMKLVILSREGQPLTSAAAYDALRTYGPRYISGAVLVLVAAGLLSFTLVGAPLALFLVVRLSLFGPAVVVEDSDITDALTRSWALLKDRWWRTAGILLAASVPWFILMVFVALVDPPTLIELILTTLGWAFIAPFITVVTLLLFEDYRRISDSGDDPRRPLLPPPDAFR